MLGDYSPQRQEYLASGVTSIRDLGGDASKGLGLRTEIETHRVLGPRLFFVGRLVTSPKGHLVSTICQASMAKQGAILAWGERSLLDGLNSNWVGGPPDAVKFIHGKIGRAKEELRADLLAKGIRWASEHHLISIVHAEMETEFVDAIAAGATGVEHAAYLKNVSASLSSIVAQNHPFVDPSISRCPAGRGSTCPSAFAMYRTSFSPPLMLSTH
jgi:hypothetical protein